MRAYTTTFQVIFSYLTLFWSAKLFGRAYRDQNIKAVHKTNAKRVYATILELQGLFIKVGQLLSIMANFLPEEFRQELEGLQDQVPPRPYSEIAPRIEEELGATVDELFDDFHREPIASASLGQVHEARTKDGQRVAVKVQHQDIDEIVRLDLKTIRRIIGDRAVVRARAGPRRLLPPDQGPAEAGARLQRSRPTTSRRSRRTSRRTRASIFPVPVRELSTSRVLTTTFVEGKKLTDLAGLDAMGIDKKELASRLVRVYCQMIFVDGVYHADPHPGNILVNSDGDLVLLDFGAVAELSQPMREGIPEFLEGVIRRDTDRLIKALRKMGFLSRTSDEAVSEKIIEYFHQQFQEEVKLESFNLKDIKIDPQRGFENLLDLRKMNVGLKELSDAFHIPRDWVLLERTHPARLRMLLDARPRAEPDGHHPAVPAGLRPRQPRLAEGRDGDRARHGAPRRHAARGPPQVPPARDARRDGGARARACRRARARSTPSAVSSSTRPSASRRATRALSLHSRGEDGTPTKVLLGVACFCGFMLLVSSIFGRPGKR